MRMIDDASIIGLNSSALARVAYEESRQRLQVEFRDGSVYVYHGVPATVYRQLLTAGSQGSYFNKEIRNVYVSELRS